MDNNISGTLKQIGSEMKEMKGRLDTLTAFDKDEGQLQERLTKINTILRVANPWFSCSCNSHLLSLTINHDHVILCAHIQFGAFRALHSFTVTPTMFPNIIQTRVGFSSRHHYVNSLF